MNATFRIALLLLTCGSAQAQDSNAIPAATPAKKLTAITLSQVPQHSKISDAIVFELTITNISDGEVTLTQVAVDSPHEVSMARRSDTEVRHRSIDPSSQPTLGAGERDYVRITVPAAVSLSDVLFLWMRHRSGKDVSRWELVETISAWWSSVWFFADDYDFTIDVQYEATGNKERFARDFFVQKVHVESSAYSIIFGAVFGCLLATIFVYTEGMLNAAKGKSRQASERFWRVAAGSAVTFLHAMITSIICILLLEILKDVPKFPVKVATDSMSGGLLIGFISPRLATWLHEFIIGSSDKTNTLPASSEKS